MKKFLDKKLNFIFIYYLYLLTLTFVYFNIIQLVQAHINVTSIIKLLLNTLIIPFQVYPIFFFYKKNNINLFKHNHSLKKLILQGILFFIPILLINIFILSYPLNISNLLTINSLIQFFQVALVEEFIFRYFIQKELTSILQSKALALLIGAFMFSFSHLIGLLFNPIENMSFAMFFIPLIRLSSKHLYFNFVFEKTGSLIPNTIVHWLNNILSL